MRETGSPVLGAYVFDSDGAYIVGADPANGVWAAWVRIEDVIPHLCPPPVEWADGEDEPVILEDDTDYLAEVAELRAALERGAYPVGEAARRAVLWAGQWGSSATASVIEQILVTREDFAEETFWNLAKALGVRARS
ncbi:hypothetical protein [Actinomadura atramentaria]|uniref:hypothetical protein n=1 Tax=Actinomadura atramentaria TaxID=1990 RepID=UPI00036859A5|nr:hypothetical protein [Actinomadura atramentaria]